MLIMHGGPCRFHLCSVNKFNLLRPCLVQLFSLLLAGSQIFISFFSVQLIFSKVAFRTEFLEAYEDQLRKFQKLQRKSSFSYQMWSFSLFPLITYYYIFHYFLLYVLFLRFVTTFFLYLYTLHYFLSYFLSTFFIYFLSLSSFSISLTIFCHYPHCFLTVLSLYFLIILSLTAFLHCSLKFLIVHSLPTFSFTIAIFSHNFVGKRFEMIDYANNILTVEIFFSKSTCRKTFYF